MTHVACPGFVHSGMCWRSPPVVLPAATVRLPPRRSDSAMWRRTAGSLDRKSTRLNSSHLVISYAVFGLKKTKDGGGMEIFGLHHERRHYGQSKVRAGRSQRTESLRGGKPGRSPTPHDELLHFLFGRAT